jgi:hypothetical protein
LEFLSLGKLSHYVLETRVTRGGLAQTRRLGRVERLRVWRIGNSNG